MAKFEVRATTEITFDFYIEAESCREAEQRVKNNYLKYIVGGKLDKQKIVLKDLVGKDRLTHLFIMEATVEDCNDAE
jgi:hypothetical protein